MTSSPQIQKLSELHQQHPQWTQSWQFNGTVDNYLQKLQQQPPPDFQLRALEKYEHSLDLAIVLESVPPKVIIQEFGEEMLLWTYINYVYSPGKDKLLSACEELTGKSADLLEKARLYTWRVLHDDNSELVMRSYNLYASVQPWISQVNLPSLLQKHQTVPLSPKKLNAYSLEMLLAENRRNIEGYDLHYNRFNIHHGIRLPIYLDTPVGIALSYEGRPNAYISFAPTNLNTLMVTQIQGSIGYQYQDPLPPEPIKVHARGLAVLHWKPLLIDIATQLAAALSFKQIAIRSGRNNPWTKPDCHHIIRLPLSKAIEKYDSFAQSLGFIQRRDKNWYHSLLRQESQNQQRHKSTKWLQNYQGSGKDLARGDA